MAGGVRALAATFRSIGGSPRLFGLGRARPRPDADPGENWRSQPAWLAEIRGIGGRRLPQRPAQGCSTMPVYLNGRFVEPQDATISVMDRGFLFGDAVYEVIRYFEGCPIDLAGHTERMDRSLRECGIEGFDPSVMGPVGEELLERHGWRDAAVYWQVSRGVAPERDHLPPDGLIPTVFATASKMPDLHECRRLRGIAAITHPDVRWRRCDIKSTNLLPNVMAKVQARDSGASE